MENENNNTTTQGTENNGEQGTNDLEARLAEAEARAEKAEAEARAAGADRDRYKKSVDSLSKEISEKKKAERAKLSEEERTAQEREEEIAKLREKAEADAKELNHLKAISAYKEIEDVETIESLIESVADQDHAAIMKIIADIRDKAVKAKEAEWKKSRPAGFVGSGSSPSLSRDEIKAITDPVERQKAIAKNLNLFN